jgi:hypothetical protein
LSGPPSRDGIRGALYSVIGTLCLEAEDAMKRLEPLLLGEEPVEEAAKPRIREAYAVAARIASKRVSGKCLVALYKTDLVIGEELARSGLERRSLELGQFVNLWLTLGSALGADKSDHATESGEYTEAVDILFAEENRRARLAALPRGMTCGELLATDFPPPQWIVPELLVSGLTILAGAPKLGKSWLALALGSAVGSGGAVLGSYRVERRRALYLALEDTPRRLRNRLEKIGTARDARLDLFTQWRSGSEGIADLDAYLEEYPDTKLVLIDTLARFRGVPQGDDRYAADYAAAAAIKAVADKHDCAIVLIHHVRKMAAEDIMDTVSGTNGLNGAADSTWVLTRARGEADASLFITGRDVEEQTLALRFDSACGTWAVLGDAAEYAQSRERREVLDAIPFEPEARKTKDIVARLGKKAPAVSRLLEKLEAEGLVFSPTYGQWSRKGGKSGNSVKVETEVKEPRQGTFTLLPDLPLDTPLPDLPSSMPTSEHIAGLSPAGAARLAEIKAEERERTAQAVAQWDDDTAQAAIAQVEDYFGTKIALGRLMAEIPALAGKPVPLDPGQNSATPPQDEELMTAEPALAAGPPQRKGPSLEVEWSDLGFEGAGSE